MNDNEIHTGVPFVHAFKGGAYGKFHPDEPPRLTTGEAKPQDDADRLAREFWERCVLMCLQEGLPTHDDDTAITVADELTSEWRKRFGPPKNEPPPLTEEETRRLQSCLRPTRMSHDGNPNFTSRSGK